MNRLLIYNKSKEMNIMAIINRRFSNDLVDISDQERKYLEDKAKEAIFNNKDTELGFVVRYWYDDTKDYYTELGVIPKNIYELSEHNIGMMSEIQVLDGTYEEHQARTEFIPYDKCTKKQKELIDKKKKEIKIFRKKVQKKPTKYEKPGHISLTVYAQSDIVNDQIPASYEVRKIIAKEKTESNYLEKRGEIKIPITQKELAEIGLLPKDYNWQEDQKNSEVSPKDISEADMTLKLTRGHIVAFDGIRRFFESKGKGEK